ncbi:MAG: phosphopyruvate hydratase [Nanoarchaeota archaeon]
MDNIIRGVKAIQVLDSRGIPTIQTKVFTKDLSAKAIVPSGLSKGKYEAFELRDNSKSYHGLSVLEAVNNVNRVISKELVGTDVTDQKAIDEFLIGFDGTPNKSRLGANAILSVSLAAARCGSFVQNKHLYEYLGSKRVLPVPFSNVINGGVHSDNRLHVQEFMIAPVKAKSFSEATMMVSEVYHSLKEVIKKRFGKHSTLVADEGGFSPPVDTVHSAFNLILKSIDECGYSNKVKLAIDCAASEFFTGVNYKIEKNKLLTSSELIDYYKNLVKTYPIVSIEDPFHQDDFSSFKELTKKLNIQVVGDDLLTTNIRRIKLAVNEKLCNALLLKPNQIGTLTESILAHRLAKESKWNVMVSHRSGDTEDTFICDLAVALGSGQVKIGTTCRAESTSKFNRLLEIENYLGSKAKYAKF